MRCSVFFMFLGLCLCKIQAQYYTIPDWDFVDELQNIVPSAMNGNQLDTTHISVLSLTEMDLYGMDIYDLDGVQYFTALEVLICQNNDLYYLPELPASLEYLNCTDNGLAFLPELPSSLVHLSCRYNELTVLPELPSSLEFLDCYNNELVVLPELPASLDSLKCSNNFLATLPELPSSLDYLVCVNNDLIALPELPASLKVLSCSNNFLTIIPELPDSLVMLICGQNDLTVLPELPDSLYYLNCQSNNLIVLPDLPDPLEWFNCQLNALIELPDLPDSLYHFDCGANDLNTIPALPDSLKWFACDGNNLDTLPVLPSSMEYLFCPVNDLIFLPELPSTLEDLQCGYNLLNSLPEMPDQLVKLRVNHNPISCLPTLPPFLEVIHCQNTNISCLPNKPPDLDWSSAILDFPWGTYCNLSNTTCPMKWESIGGTVFQDDNGNGVKDPGEPPFTNAVVQAQPGNYLTTPDTNGTYVLPVDTGTFTVGGQPVLYHNQTTAAVSIILGQFEVDSLNHIGYQAIPGIYDLMVDLEAQPARPGVDNNLWLQVKNIGTETSTADITLQFDVDQSWVGSSETPDSQVGSSATWSTTLVPGASWSANVTLSTSGSTPLGTQLLHILTALPQQPDTTLTNNTDTLDREVVGYYDPNHKLLVPSSMSAQELQTGLPVEYTIRFQNNGSTYVERILIIDTLSTDLEWQTMEFASSSHPCSWFIQEGVLHFLFEPIFLPDTITDELNSHGYVKFRMELNHDLQPGEEVLNVARIYFDFNTPVITEPAVFEVELIDGIVESTSGRLAVWPNPADNLLQMMVPETGRYHVQVRDLTGKTVVQQSFSGQTFEMDISDLADGLYLVKLCSEERIYSSKFVKH